MRIPKFEYFRPLSIEDVCSILYKYKTEAKILAGGTDLFVKMKKKEILPRVIVSLNGIQKLDRIEWDEVKGLKIGPLATHDALVNHPIIRGKFDFLSEACFKIGTRQVRNMGTLVGNLCNASPSSDASAPLLVLETKLKLVHLYGEKTIPLEEFFVGPFQTVLDPEAIVAEVQIPNPPHIRSALTNTFTKPLLLEKPWSERLCFSQWIREILPARRQGLASLLLLQPPSG